MHSYAPNFEEVEGYAPNFKEVEGAKWFGPVWLSFFFFFFYAPEGTSGGILK